MGGETLVKVFPNEMEARLWAGVLEDEGIRSMIKPHGVGYGGWGQSAFLPHGVYVLTENIENARAIIQNGEEERG